MVCRIKFYHIQMLSRKVILVYTYTNSIRNGLFSSHSCSNIINSINEKQYLVAILCFTGYQEDMSTVSIICNRHSIFILIIKLGSSISKEMSSFSFREFKPVDQFQLNISRHLKELCNEQHLLYQGEIDSKEENKWVLRTDLIGQTIERPSEAWKTKTVFQGTESGGSSNISLVCLIFVISHEL